MMPYVALWRMRFRTLVQYRAAAIAGIATQFLFGLVMASVLRAFYAYSTGPQPMTLAQSISYTWVGQAMLGMLPWSVDREMRDSVRTGGIAYDLARPLSVYQHWFARCLAMRTAPTLLKSVPMFFIALFLLPAPVRMAMPAPLGVAAWLLATLGALILSCAVTLLLQATLFWTVTGDGITRLVPHFITLFSGMIIPLPLFPDWAQAALRVQPFAGLTDLPARLLCGALPPSGVFSVLITQLAWSAVFILLGSVIVRIGLRRVAVAGG